MLVTLFLLAIKDFHPIYSVAIIVGLICVWAYIPLRSTFMKSELETSGKYFNFLIFLSIILILWGIQSFIFRPEQYVKPLSYYIIMALSCGALFLAVLNSKSKRQFYIIIAIACFIGLTHIWTENFLFPNSLIGLDPWYHMEIVTKQLSPTGITEVPIGITTIGTSYSLFHLYLKEIMDVIPIDYKMASLIFAGSIQIVSTTVLVGLIGRKIFNYKIGATASIVVAIANWNIFFGEWIIPNAIGAILSLAMAYLILSGDKSKWQKIWVKVLIGTIILAMAYFTHILAALWVLATLICLFIPYVVVCIYKKIKNRENKWGLIPSISIVVIIFSSLPLWLNFTTAGNSISQTSGKYDFNPSLGLTYAVGSVPDDLLGNNSDEKLNNNSLGELTIDTLGMLLYIGFAILGMLIMVKRKELSNKLWVLLGAGILTIGFFPPLFGKSFLEYRWWYFAEILLSIPLAVAFISISKSKVLIGISIFMVCLIAFLSTIGLPSNITNRTLSHNLIVRYALTDKEMQGLEIIKTYHPKIVGTDLLYCDFLSSSKQYSGHVIPINDNLVYDNFSKVKVDMLVIRNAVYEEPFGFGGGTIYKLNPNFLNSISIQGYREIWSNEQIRCFVKDVK